MSNKNLNQKFHWRLGPKAYPTYDITHKKTQTQNFPIFPNASERLTVFFEGLNSSLAQSPGELQSCKVVQKWQLKVGDQSPGISYIGSEGANTFAAGVN